MAFHLSAEDVRIEDNHFLRAMLRNEAGELCFSEVDLDVHIGNDNGMLTPHLTFHSTASPGYMKREQNILQH